MANLVAHQRNCRRAVGLGRQPGIVSWQAITRAQGMWTGKHSGEQSERAVRLHQESWRK